MYKKNFKDNESISDFLKNLSEVFVYKGTVCILATGITVVVARSFTVSEFAKIGIINILSYLLCMPMIMGANNSMYKMLPASTEKEKDELIMVSITGNAIFAIVLCFLYLHLYKYVSVYIKLTRREWMICIATAFAANICALTESFLRGRKKYVTICKIKLVSVVLNLMVLLIFLFIFKEKDPKYYFCSLIISQFVFCGLAVARSNISCIGKIRWETVKRVYVYGVASTFGTLTVGAIFSSDILFVQYFCDNETVGVYTAYQGFLKNIFAVLFFEIFMVVFLPSIAQADHAELQREIRKRSILIFFFVSAGSVIIMSFFIILFGAGYALNSTYVILSSVGMATYAIFQLYLSVTTMKGSKSAFKVGIMIASVLPISFCVQIYMTRNWHVVGALAGAFLSNLLMIFTFEAMRILDNLYTKSTLLIQKHGGSSK